MKKALLILLTLSLLSLSCARSPYKKRKPCKGNGSWYGNRGLGQTTINNKIKFS
jgi:hypothetical protein